MQEPVYDNYLDAPQTPGTWLYESVDGGSIARFGTQGDTVFAIGCMANSRSVLLMREGANNLDQALMTVRTETTTRALDARGNQDRDAVSVALPANDRLLDAMAITKGRFAIGVEGTRTLYLPAWVEVSRVIEDCR